MDIIKLDYLLSQLPDFKFNAQKELSSALLDFDKKIIVLDDDPTGVQTVHDIPVYTCWEQSDIDSGFSDEGMFFILTNSRGLTSSLAEELNRDIAKRIHTASKATSKEFVIISRSDSTLRGHYPLETDTLKRSFEEYGDIKFDGEIICPFFIEGGRYTYNDVHYVLQDNDLVPAAQTEFSKDRTFGYSKSNLKEWVEEKTLREYKKETVISISIDMIRQAGPEAIYMKLMETNEFNKIIVNAVSYDDIRIFLAGYIKATSEGKNFIFRSAAAIPKLLGGVSDIPLLSKEQLIFKNKSGGLVVVGSHVEKTSLQLSALLDECDIVPIEFNQHLVFNQTQFEIEQERVKQEINHLLREGKDVVVFTRRERIDMNKGNIEEELLLTNKISAAVTNFVKNLSVIPSYIIAKGGITSSEIGTVGLSVRKAIVAGQVLPGIPVWRLGEESRFPGMAYIIFPGNVGDVSSLCRIVQSLKE